MVHSSVVALLFVCVGVCVCIYRLEISLNRQMEDVTGVQVFLQAHLLPSFTFLQLKVFLWCGIFKTNIKNGFWC